jgi:hypothetical protein
MGSKFFVMSQPLEEFDTVEEARAAAEVRAADAGARPLGVFTMVDAFRAVTTEISVERRDDKGVVVETKIRRLEEERAAEEAARKAAQLAAEEAARQEEQLAAEAAALEAVDKPRS